MSPLLDAPPGPSGLDSPACFLYKVSVRGNGITVEGLVIIAANFLVAVGKVLDIILTIYMYIIIARALISWVNPDPYNPIVNFLNRVTEPVLYRIRKRLPAMGGLDLSPIIVLLVIFFLQKFAVNSILDLGYRMKLGMGGFP